MTSFLIASLIAFFAPAPPDAPIQNAPYDRCTLGGWNPIFEIDDKTELPDQLPSGKFRLFQNGSWHRAVWANGELSITSGCLPDAQFADLERITKLLARAPWKTHRAAVACFAYSASYREYRVAGKLVYTERVCDGLILDKLSQRVLADARAYVAPLIAP